MKEVVRVAAAQVDVAWLKPEVNLAKMQNTIEKITQASKVDLVVFPELANSGWVIGRDKEEFADFSRDYLKAAERIPGPYTEALGESAKKHSVYVIAGLLEINPAIPATLYNSAVLIGPSGEIIGTYRKAHIPGEEKHYFIPGSSTEVFATELGNIGMLICADNSFPESARALCLQGAEIICVPYARPIGIGSDAELYFRIASCRAYENNTFFIACNKVGKEGNLIFEGRSCICGPGGEFLARSETDTEEIISAELRAEALQVARMKHSRFRDRRPDLYGIICQPF